MSIIYEFKKQLMAGKGIKGGRQAGREVVASRREDEDKGTGGRMQTGMSEPESTHS